MESRKSETFFMEISFEKLIKKIFRMHEVKTEFKGLSLPDTARALFMCARENAYIIVTMQLAAGASKDIN